MNGINHLNQGIEENKYILMITKIMISYNFCNQKQNLIYENNFRHQHDDICGSSSLFLFSEPS